MSSSRAFPPKSALHLRHYYHMLHDCHINHNNLNALHTECKLTLKSPQIEWFCDLRRFVMKTIINSYYLCLRCVSNGDTIYNNNVGYQNAILYQGYTRLSMFWYTSRLYKIWTTARWCAFCCRALKRLVATAKDARPFYSWSSATFSPKITPITCSIVLCVCVLLVFRSDDNRTSRETF